MPAASQLVEGGSDPRRRSPALGIPISKRGGCRRPPRRRRLGIQSISPLMVRCPALVGHAPDRGLPAAFHSVTFAAAGLHGLVRINMRDLQPAGSLDRYLAAPEQGLYGLVVPRSILARARSLPSVAQDAT